MNPELLDAIKRVLQTFESPAIDALHQAVFGEGCCFQQHGAAERCIHCGKARSELDEHRPRFVLVNLGLPVGIEVFPGQYYVPGEEACTYGSLADAALQCLELREEHDNPDILIYRLAQIPEEEEAQAIAQARRALGEA